MSTGWMEQAACRNADPELFFGVEGERRGALRRRQAAAKAVCAGCPVTAACLVWAIGHDERGVWAGTTEANRRDRVRSAKGLPAKPRGRAGMSQKRPVRPAEARTAPSATPGPSASPVRPAVARSGAAGSGART